MKFLVTPLTEKPFIVVEIKSTREFDGRPGREATTVANLKLRWISKS